MKSFQPLLAATCEDIAKLRYPVLASPKLDGIRCVKLDGRALTRKLKPIPNAFVREWIETNLPDGIDGELMLRGRLTAPFEEVSSAIMSRGGEPDFVFCAFDLLELEREGFVVDDERPFQERYESLVNWIGPGTPQLLIVLHEQIEHADKMQQRIDLDLSFGYEGTMVRSPGGLYKFGRSTLKEGILLKIKPWHDEEATVVGVVEQQHNENPLQKDERGYAKRSSAKAGKVGARMLGTLACLTEDGVEFEIGTGFTEEQRIKWWGSLLGQGLVGRQVKFKHLGRMQSGAPRGPVFLGWRED